MGGLVAGREFLPKIRGCGGAGNKLQKRLLCLGILWFKGIVQGNEFRPSGTHFMLKREPLCHLHVLVVQFSHVAMNWFQVHADVFDVAANVKGRHIDMFGVCWANLKFIQRT